MAKRERSEWDRDESAPVVTPRIWNWQKREGKAGWILLWLLGVPIPVLLFLFLIRGCT